MVSELLNANPFSLEAMKNSDYVATAYASNLEPPDSDKNFLKASDLPDSDFYGRDAPSGLRILSTIKRAFPLPERLTRFSDPLKFPADADGMRVESFGLRSGKGSLVVLPQSIELRDYVSDDDFIVSLFSVTKPGTEIVLAKVVPERTLRKTWDIVNDRLNTSREQNRQLGENIAQYHRSPCSGDSPKGPTYWDMRWRQTDELQIPVLSIGIVAAIPELIGTALPTTQQPDRAIVDVRIAVRLSIDDCGSESIPEPQPPPVNDCGGDLDSPKVNPRRMIYDKPFLLAIREWNAESPYFLGWIANAELMQAAR